MPTGICHKIIGHIPIVTPEKLGVIERLEYGFRRDTKTGLILHYSHSRALGWNFEVIFTKGSNKDLVSQFSITNQQFLDIKRITNSETKHEVKNVGVFNSLQEYWKNMHIKLAVSSSKPVLSNANKPMIISSTIINNIKIREFPGLDFFFQESVHFNKLIKHNSSISFKMFIGKSSVQLF